MAKKKSNINKYTNGLEINEIYSKISRGSSFIPGVIDESKLTSRVVKKDKTFKAKPFAKSYKSIRPVLSSGFSSRGNFRTNYTPPPLFDTDASAFFTAIEDAGGTLTDNVKSEFDAFVVREKDAGRWSKIKRLYPYLGGVINSAVIDAVTLNSATNVNFVNADVDATIGLQGDGLSKYLNTDDVMNSIITDNYNWQIGHFIIGGIPTLTSLIRPMGYYRSTGTRGAAYLQIDTSKRPSAFGNWSSISVGSSGSLATNSSHFGAKFSASELILMHDGVKKSTNTTIDTDVLIDLPMTMFAFPINGTYQSFSLLNHSGYFLATGMTEADLTAFNTSYKTFINNIQAYAALMDSYSGAAVAYSLRKVYSTYEGSAINVRRSSDNTTQDIGFDGYVLDEAALLSFVGAGNGFVTTWYDQSGNGLDAIQSTASAQRQIVSSGSVLKDNGKPASKDIAATTQYNISTPIYAADAANIWSFSVQNADNTATNTAFILGANTFDGYLVTTWSNIEAVDIRTVRTGGSSTALMGSTGDLLGQHILSSYADRTTVAAYLDGTLLSGSRADSDTDFVAITNNTFLGTSNSTARSFDGYFQEFILWEVDQSANRAAIETLINTYYNIY